MTREEQEEAARVDSVPVLPAGGSTAGQNEGSRMTIVIGVLVALGVVVVVLLAQKSQWREREPFGNGDHAPHWPSRKWNGHYTLYRGVWIDDEVREKPSDAVLDTLRREYAASRRVIHFTLVEGEQDAPMGKNGAIIRVRVRAGQTSVVRDSSGRVKDHWPTVSVAPASPEHDGWLGTTFSGSLPLQMSVSVAAVDPVAAN